MFACVCVLESDWCLDSHISTLQGTEINSLTTHFQAFISKEFDIIARYSASVFSRECCKCDLSYLPLLPPRKDEWFSIIEVRGWGTIHLCSCLQYGEPHLLCIVCAAQRQGWARFAAGALWHALCTVYLKYCTFSLEMLALICGWN